MGRMQEVASQSKDFCTGWGPGAGCRRGGGAALTGFQPVKSFIPLGTANISYHILNLPTHTHHTSPVTPAWTLSTRFAACEDSQLSRRSVREKIYLYIS